MIKQFFEMIKTMNDGEVSIFETGVSNYSMGIDAFRISCSVVERDKAYYLEYNLEYYNNGRRHLLDEGYFRYNHLETSVAVERKFPNFLKYGQESPSKFLSYKVKSQNEHTADLLHYDKFYSRINDIDEALENFIVKIPGIDDSQAFLEDYKKKSKLIAKAFVITSKLYIDNSK